MPTGGNHSNRDLIIVAILALGIAIASAKPYAGGWNDGSRLATIESLVDRGTFVIDDSIFVKVPPGARVYAPEFEALNQTGSLDRLYINGRFYSDKSPVPAILLAGVYKTVQLLTGLSATESPAAFCSLMNFFGAGLPYAAAVVAMFLMARHLSLLRESQWILTLSFALATIAPAYARTVNNHVMLLGLVAAALVLMMQLTSSERKRLTGLTLGAAMGLGYTIDLGIGPVLLVATGLWMIYYAIDSRRLLPLVLFAIAAAPWLVLHHVVNYSIAGTIGPANAKPEYLQWPGCPFDSATMTGRWHHATMLDFFVYSLDLLWGQKGIISHNLPLALAVVAMPVIIRRNGQARSILLSSLVWSAGAFVLYAATSNNYSGLCLSVRWFVPMLAPAYLVLALLLRDRPEIRADLIWLSSVNAVWAYMAWQTNWWSSPPLAWHWIIMTIGLCGWGSKYVILQANRTGLLHRFRAATSAQTGRMHAS